MFGLKKKALTARKVTIGHLKFLCKRNGCKEVFNKLTLKFLFYYISMRKNSFENSRYMQHNTFSGFRDVDRTQHDDIRFASLIMKTSHSPRVGK